MTELTDFLDIGGTLLGGIFGQKEGSRNRAMYRKQLKQAQGQFDAQMDESIQRRVKDAIAAGVHPLFAMGASVGASPTVSSGQPPQSGNAMGDAVAEIGRIMGNLPSEKAKIKKDEAEAALYNAEAAKITQDLNSRGRDVVNGGVKTYPLPDQEPLGEAVYFNPQIPKKSRPGVVAGRQPGVIEMEMADGRIVEVYNPDLGLDEIGQFKFFLERSRHKAADMMEWTDQKITNWVRKEKERFKDQWRKTKFKNNGRYRRY